MDSMWLNLLDLVAPATATASTSSPNISRYFIPSIILVIPVGMKVTATISSNYNLGIFLTQILLLGEVINQGRIVQIKAVSAPNVTLILCPYVCWSSLRFFLVQLILVRYLEPLFSFCKLIASMLDSYYFGLLLECKIEMAVPYFHLAHNLSHSSFSMRGISAIIWL
nr:hypothetical protein CFP56_08170 [Quercus suber]